MSSRTTSTSRSEPLYTVVVALGSNLGDRDYNLRRAIQEVRLTVSVVRLSAFHRTSPVDAPPGSPDFLNAVLAGYTRLLPLALIGELLAIERRLGRVRGRVKNAPRTIDLDLVLHSGHRVATTGLTLPHPRAAGREFVLQPMRELGVARLLAAASTP